MLRFIGTKITKEKIYAAKKPITIWHVNVDKLKLVQINIS